MKDHVILFTAPIIKMIVNFKLSLEWPTRSKVSLISKIMVLCSFWMGDNEKQLIKEYRMFSNRRDELI